jgi:hypothetical protein
MQNTFGIRRKLMFKFFGRRILLNSFYEGIEKKKRKSHRYPTKINEN